MNIHKVTVIGLGLIGGSLAWSIREKGLARVVGYARREDTIRQAVEKSILDEGISDIADSVKGSQLVFLCTTINSIPEIARDIAEHVEPGTIIVDVASTKQHIVRELNEILPQNVTFVGGHPMAGSEKSGIEAADKDLFEGATFILTPYKNVNNASLVKLNNFIEKLNMRVEYLSPDDHDTAVAAVSHLPYLIASTLVHSVGSHELADSFLRVAASGFRDTTRVASSPAVWGKNICVTNKEQVLAMLDRFKDNLNYLESLIKLNKEKELLDFFEAGREYRKKLRS